MIVLGDCAIPGFNPDLKFYDFGTKPGTEKQEHYKLKFLNNKPGTTIFLAGNHDNYDLIKKMPDIELYGTKIKQMQYENIVYNNIYYINKPCFMNIKGTKILFINGAESHDTELLFEYDHPDTKTVTKHLEKQWIKGDNVPTYRINHFSGWKEEAIDKQAVKKLLPRIPKEIDFILSHDCPASVLSSWKPKWTSTRLKPTKSEIILEEVRQQVDYKRWFHGHLHEEIYLPHLKTFGLYSNIYNIEEFV